MPENIDPWKKWVKDAKDQQLKEEIRAGNVVPDEVIDPYLKTIEKNKQKQKPKNTK